VSLLVAEWDAELENVAECVCDNDQLVERVALNDDVVEAVGDVVPVDDGDGEGDCDELRVAVRETLSENVPDDDTESE
jgi:hypothetical protein